MKTISLDQLIALNDEIAALARAGVPLDRGLLHLGEDVPGRLGQLATAIGRRLETGESLSQIVSHNDSSFPPLYSAVVEAGLRSGRLSVALEGLATSLRRVAQLRRMVGVSLLYPLAVLATAYVMFLLSVFKTTPILDEAYRGFGFANSAWVDWMGLVATAVTLFWYVPLVLVPILLTWWWYRSGQFSAKAGSGWLTGRIPSLGNSLRAGRIAAFAETLTLLVDQEVPLDEALVLAADTSGDAPLRESSRTLAERIRRGEPVASQHGRLPGFPPLLGWLIAQGGGPRELSRALRHLADTYRDQAQRVTSWLLIYLPIILTVAVGGGATIILAVSVLGPWFNLLYRLAMP